MRVLLADDDTSLRRVLQFKLEKNGYEVVAVADGREALEQLEQNEFDLLLSDIKMPGIDGLELLESTRGLRPSLKVILITAHATVAEAVQAVKLGAFDYITKPFEDDQLFVVIDKALAFRKLEDENRRLKDRLNQDLRSKLIGVSKPFREMLATVEKIAGTDATVLLTGESGTGKELIARTIHALSGRSDREFIAVNCAAIPRDLIESELFGHTRGAFTGAVRDKRGKFELAAGGTILLDEIGELAIELQAKLLRVIQERAIEPVGAERAKFVDLRIVGSTNVKLAERVAQGTFREDLFYRLNVIPIEIPTLSSRHEDIPLLVDAFIKRFAPDDSVTVESALMDRLKSHPWPGNIRELENLIERMVILRSSNLLTPADLPTDFGRPSSTGLADSASPRGGETFQQAERRVVLEALERTGWNRTKAARLLDIPRHVLVYRIKKYDLTEPESE